VLNFKVQAASGYNGFGNGVLKYPNTFSNYLQLPNTQLVAPITGTLKGGDKVTFSISSRDYSYFAIVIKDQWNRFTRNNSTGNYELTMTVPNDLDTLEIMGSPTQNGQYWSLVQYNIEKTEELKASS
jgi:hypothetical protein